MSEATAKPDAGWRPPALARVLAAEASTAAPAADDPEQVRREGYEAGYAEGLAAGRAQGESIAAEMMTLMQGMAAPFRDSEAVLLRELLSLVERAVYAVIDREIEQTDPDLERILTDALRILGAVQVPVAVTLNPVDAALCRDMGLIEEPGMSIVEDDRVHRGGLKLRAGSTIVDASIEARLEEIFAELRLRAGVPEAKMNEAAESADDGD